MRQVIKHTEFSKPSHGKKKRVAKKKDPKLPQMQKPTKEKRKHPKFGTSKLEKDFAKNILDKLGIEYEWQFEAKEIKRFYDFYIPNSRILIEVDGDYYHSYDLVREDMSPMQKKNQRVDNIKNKWAALHGIPLIRIWEHDIRKSPAKVMKMLKEKINYRNEEISKKEELTKKRHINALK
jgi:very-short-patch-repair endonuclease